MIKRIQECDRCGTERRLEETDSLQKSGWREIPMYLSGAAGGLCSKTFCTGCLTYLGRWFEETKTKE